LSPRPDVSEQRKQQIINAAMRVFSRLGLHEARMDDIVEESGLSKGTIYWYFDSKDDIVIAILENLFSDEFIKLDLSSDPDRRASDMIDDYLSSMLQDVKKMLTMLPLTYEFYSLAFRNERIRSILSKYFEEYMKKMVPVIQKGIDDGEFQPLDATDVAVTLGATYEGLLLMWMYDPSIIDLDHHYEAAIQLIIKGLKV
jgi:TetR/AcrR family fatty acid metabolism transcriptional regulator